MYPLPCKLPDHMLEMHPKYRGRVHGAWPSCDIDISGYNRYLKHNAVRKVPGPQGGSANVYNGTSSYSTCRSIDTEARNGQGTIIIRYYLPSSQVNKRMCGQSSTPQFLVFSNTISHYGRTIAAGAWANTTALEWRTVCIGIGKRAGNVGQTAMDSYEKGKRVGGGDNIEQPNGGAWVSPNSQWSIGAYTSNNSSWSSFINAQIDLCVVLNYRVPDNELRALSLDPLLLFQQRMPFRIAPTSSGTNYTDTVTEGSIWAETRTPTSQLHNSVVESSIASDTVSANAALRDTVSDGATASDTLLAGLLLQESVSDGGVGSDSSTGLKSQNELVSEGSVSSDSVSSLAARYVTLAESGIYAEVRSPVMAGLVTIAEGGIVSDVESKSLGAGCIVSESSVSSDHYYGWVSSSENVSDSGVISDGRTVSVGFYSEVSESSTWSDTGSNAKSFLVYASDGGIWSETRASGFGVSERVSDGGQLSDTVTDQAGFRVQISDGSTHLDSVRLGWFDTVSDMLCATDSQNLGYFDTVSDMLCATDSVAFATGYGIYVADGSVSQEYELDDNGRRRRIYASYYVFSPYTATSFYSRPVIVDMNSPEVEIAITSPASLVQITTSVVEEDL